MIDVVIPIFQDSIPEVAYRTVETLIKNTKDAHVHLVLSSETQPKNINLVLEQIRAKYFVIMDWDVLVPENWLPTLLETMEEKYDCGILGVKMFGEKYHGANADIEDGETKLFDNVAAGLMLCRNAKIKWDESYPSGYYADTDFCRQYQAKKLNVYLTGKVKVEHICQESGATPENLEKGKQIFTDKWAKESPDNVSLLIISWNQLETVKLSVENALKDNLEVWVVDNGSTDGTQKYLKEVKGINVIQFHTNMGISYARNRVVEQFTKDYLMMLDGDIVYIPGSAKAMMFELSLSTKNVYCLGIHNTRNGTDNWGGVEDCESSDKEWVGLGDIKFDIPIAWTQYGVFRGNVIRKYKFPEYGPFYGPGWGFEDDWIHAKLEEDGYIAAYCTRPMYWHKNRSSSRDKLVEEMGSSLHDARREELKKRFPNFLHWSERPR